MFNNNVMSTVVEVSYNNCCCLQIQTLGLHFLMTSLRVTCQINVSLRLSVLQDA